MKIKTSELTGAAIAAPAQAAALVLPSDDGFMAAVNEMDGLYAAPLAITSAPDRIWLDLGFNPYEDDVHFSRLHDLTWSQNNATGDGIEYVRADLAARGAAQAALADPMQWPLPCDVKVGHVTIPKGCALNTLVTRMQVLYEMGVDAPERPYDRGFRHGYNRRDAEVKGALL